MNKHIFHYAETQDVEKVLIQKTNTKYGFVDQHGNNILNLLAGWGAFTLGFDRHDIIDHVANSVKTLNYDFPDGYNSSDSRKKLSDKLSDMSGGYYSVFGVTGSDSIETAAYISTLYHPDRKTILSLKNSYHGATYLCRTAGKNVNNPDYTKYGKHAESIFLKELESKINSDVSCFIIESCSWISGLYSYSENTWQTIRKLCKENDVLLVIDDIAMCGGKTGSFFGIDIPALQPDIICMGKAVSGGYFPLSITLINPSVFEKIKNTQFRYGYTYSASMSGIESSLKYIDILEKENLLESVHDVINKCRDVFDDLKSKGNIKDYRNYGTVFNLDLYEKVSRQQLLGIGLISANAAEADAADSLLLSFPINSSFEYIETVHQKFSNFLPRKSPT